MTEILQALSDFGGFIVLAGLLVTGLLVPKVQLDRVIKERDNADKLRDARLDDQKQINRELIDALKEQTEAQRRLADAIEVRNRIEAERGLSR